MGDARVVHKRCARVQSQAGITIHSSALSPVRPRAAKSGAVKLSRHPSLGAEFTGLPALRPAEVMDPYVPCWCLSGKKWKFCHKGRDLANPIPIGKLINDMRLATIKGYCTHPLAGSKCGKVINSHTIQRRGGLSEIAEDGHVYSVKEGGNRIFENDGKIIPHKVGCRSASTFAGFCGAHDAKMFAPIEAHAPSQTKENIFLFSFRAVAYEQFFKRSAYAHLDVQRQADYGKPFFEQLLIQEYLHYYKLGLERGMSDIDEWKQKYDNAYYRCDYSNFSGYACTFSATLPVACCGAFHPEVDFSGKQLQIISRGEAEFEHVAVSLTPVNGSTLLTFGWFGLPDGPTDRFARSFMNLDHSTKSNAAIHLAFEHLENTYISPTWWDQLGTEAKDTLIYRSMTGIGPAGPDRAEDSLTRLYPTLSTTTVASETLLS